MIVVIYLNVEVIVPSKSKAKGNGFEREIVQDAIDLGLEAKRAWGSNGQSLGMHEEVDVLLQGFKVQCKRRKKLSAVVQPNANVDIQIFREDRGTTMAMIPYDMLLSFLVLLNATNQLTEVTNEHTS